MLRPSTLSHILHVVIVLALVKDAIAASISLPSFPLAVKSPYLSAWLPVNQASHAPTAQPQFWTGTASLTWSVLARVNGVAYTLFGVPGGILNATAATQIAPVNFTSSHTYFYLTAGNVAFTLDFFSPVLPKTSDYAQQSLPYSYLSVSAQPMSNNYASIQVMSGIDNSWTAQGGAANLTFAQSNGANIFEFANPNAITYTESSDMATWGTIVFASSQTKKTFYSCSASSTVYTAFTLNGALPAPVGGVCRNTDLAALAVDLGTVKTSASTTFIVGFDRVQAINYFGQAYTGYYRSKWPTIPEAVAHVLSSYNKIEKQSTQFDALVISQAQSVSSTFGSNYSDILEASVRQVFAALEITIPLSTMSTHNPYAFLKEISSDGNVNTIDVILPTFPVFISLNPAYLKLLLQPVMDYLMIPPSKGWPKNFVIHDIGSAYPNATGHNNGVEEDMPLFETSALFTLLYAYQSYSGDKTFAKQYTTLLDQYAVYLVNNALYPTTQLISVDAIYATANQTGLAIQSAIGLAAAGVLLKNNTYSAISAAYASQIYHNGLGLNTGNIATATHFTYNYGAPTSWGTVFPAYLDVLLGLNTFPSQAWVMQSNWYLSQNKPAGLPFFGPYNYTTPLTGGGCDWSITDWSFWASAASNSTALQEAVISATHAFVSNGLNTEPFGTKYIVEAPGTPGIWIGNRARSTVGANFALVAKQLGTWKSLYSG